MDQVVIVVADLRSLIIFRSEFVRIIASQGHKVTVMAAPASNEQIQQIEKLGVQFRSYPVQRNGLNPLKDIQTFIALLKEFYKLKPTVLITCFIKPIIFGGLAARAVRNVSFFAITTGLGFAFHGESIFRKILKIVVVRLYKMSLANAKRVIFQNIDNLNEFVDRSIVPRSKCSVFNGCGVDLLQFAQVKFSVGYPVFLCIARLLGEKGLREYAQAAHIVKQRYPDTVFRLLGPPDPSPDRISLEELQKWCHQGMVEYLGETNNVRPFIAASHIYVLPSYHEGMPRTVVEAMSMGRPILTTYASGCRETVIQGENGFLVPARDANALAERMIWFVEHRDQWQRMGQASRQMAEERFNVHKINADLLRIMKLDVAAA